MEIKKEDITEGITKFNADLVNLECDYGKLETFMGVTKLSKLIKLIRTDLSFNIKFLN